MESIHSSSKPKSKVTFPSSPSPQPDLSDEQLLLLASQMGNDDRGSKTGGISTSEHTNTSVSAAFSTQVPANIFTTPHRSKLNSAYSQSKTYRLFIAPEDLNELNRYYFKRIGDSANFCTNKDCRTNHNGDKWLVAPGDVFIWSNSKSAFIEPSVSSVFWEDNFKNQWSQDSATLSEWVHSFGLVRSKLESGDNEQIDNQAIKVENDIMVGALNFKSTRKRKALQKPDPNPIAYNIGVDLDDYEMKSLSIDTMTTCLVNMDQGLQKVIADLHLLHSQTWKQEAENRMAFIQGEEKFKFVEANIGLKPTTTNPELDAPTLWSSIGLLGPKLSNFSHNIDSHISKRAKRESEKALASPVETIMNKIKIQRHTIIALTSGLQRLEGQLYELRNAATPHISNQSRIDLNSSRFQRIEEEIVNLEKASEKESVRFGKLGLKSYAEAAIWMDLNCHKDSDFSGFGYFSDVHVVLEIINIEMGNSVATNPNIDSIKDRADLIKLKLKNEWERYTITSFDRTIPKLFLSNAKFQIVKDSASYFDTVSTWEQWKSTEMGFRTRIIRALTNHKRTMEDYLQWPINLCWLVFLG